MTNNSLQEKYKRATGVICKQGIVPLPVNNTTIAIVKNVIQDNEKELDFIYKGFDDKPSKTIEELKPPTNLSEQEIETLADSLAKKGFIFNQPSSAGIRVYRILPLMTVGLLEYRFMGKLTGSKQERELAELFQNLIEEMKDQVQSNYDALVPLLKEMPPIDRTVPVKSTEEGKPIRVISVDRSVDMPEEMVLPSQSIEEIIEKFDEIAVGHCFCRQRQSVLGHSCSIDAPNGKLLYLW